MNGAYCGECDPDAVKKASHGNTSQYLKVSRNTEIRRSGRQMIAATTIFSQPPIQPQEKCAYLFANVLSGCAATHLG